MNEMLPSLLEILATLALFVGPGIGWLIAKRKERSESLLADIEAVRGWAAERRMWDEDRRKWDQERREMETEIETLRNEVSEERTKRREDRAKSEEERQEMIARIEKLEELLQDCTGATLS
jgi:hypothetical protein